MNLGSRFEGQREWASLLISALGNSVGLMLILVIQYSFFASTGTIYWKDEWLYVNLLFGVIPMMFVLPVFNRLFFRMTGRVYLGPMITCLVFVLMMLTSNVCTYLSPGRRPWPRTRRAGSSRKAERAGGRGARRAVADGDGAGAVRPGAGREAFEGEEGLPLRQPQQGREPLVIVAGRGPRHHPTKGFLEQRGIEADDATIERITGIGGRDGFPSDPSGCSEPDPIGRPATSWLLRGTRRPGRSSS